MRRSIAILGCGPAGLMAAHAVAQRKLHFVILSRPEYSNIGGAQFLHRPIPELTSDEPDTMVTYRLAGDPELYREKVYGGNPRVDFVSMAMVKDGQQVPAWSLRYTYHQLLAAYGGAIWPTEINAQWLEENMDDFEMIISSIPLHHICRPWSSHQFPMARVIIKNEALDPNIPEDTIWYDGTKDHSWYRMSRIFGIESTEWGANRRPPLPGLVTAHKPLKTNCNCWPDLVKIGRHGRWEKGVLSHDGYYRVKEILDAM